ncbi:homoserine dehydrogenase [Halanaerobium saccharolyticum]|uniref:Homoserine dehydrogenase n=1 Tax=Halanaerobium saccharolyticum TaxID=43595 RepID=A0A4R7ZDM7_9FIRM|nr:homoserine dehydrogenase [Halanaerobium saccharolyticum]RAK11143.1 homoserine dehydrogenase [Halanaerobium saccharolyticum]TDW06994.1 homoserine dehydrogenase [Halanaerobium saccharolyticum]TDX63759.1 homoserine dehydrogenase [Halanaerobium saccharolyticum]
MLKLALITNQEGLFQKFFNFFEKNINQIEKLTAQKVEITYILNNSVDKKIPSSFTKKFKKTDFIKDYNKILADPEVDIILELSRKQESSDYLLRALKNKKIVITSNLKVIAENYLEIRKMEKRFESRVFFSAAFSPLPIKTLIDNFYALDELEELNAILNATTNYILAEMEKYTISMKETVEQAKELSYTEENTDLDLNGVDSLNKIIILTNLFYNTALDPALINAKGIKGITSYDLIYAAELGYKIKLICTIKKENKELYLGVRPNLIPQDSFLASINENSNGVEILSNYNAKTTFTAENSDQASVNLLSLDLIKAAEFIKNKNQSEFNIEIKNISVSDYYQEKFSSFYVRLQLEKDEEIIDKIKKIFSEKNLADLILHDNLTETPLLPVIILTKKIKEKDLEELLEEVEDLEGVLTVNNIIAVKEA